MANHKISVLILVPFMVTLSFFGNYPKVVAPPAPAPDQFIAGIFPGSNNTNIHLLNARANLSLDATELFKVIGITFDGRYTLFNPENSTLLAINLPFSLCFNIFEASFVVFVNDTKFPFELVNNTLENLTRAGIHIKLIPTLVVHCPISLIRINLTLLANITYIIKYHFNGSIPSPLAFRDLFYLVYSSDTAKYWKGNATERVEVNVWGGTPGFSRAGVGIVEGLPELLDIEGGKRYICQWNNSQNSTIQIGITFYGKTHFFLYELIGIIEIILLIGLFYGIITYVIVMWGKKRNN